MTVHTIPPVAPAAPAPVPPVAPAAAPAPMFNPFTGQPIPGAHIPAPAPVPMYDPYTGAPIAPAPAPMPSSGFQVIEQQLAQTTAQAAEVAELTANIVWEKGFDKVIMDNKALFKNDAPTMRAPYAKAGLQGTELNHALKCVAIQDFFSEEKNILVLHPDDQAYLRASVIKQPDIAVDSTHAWAILENAIHISKRIQQNVDFRRSGANIDNIDTPNVAAFLQRIKDQGAGIKPTAKTA